MRRTWEGRSPRLDEPILAIPLTTEVAYDENLARAAGEDAAGMRVYCDWLSERGDIRGMVHQLWSSDTPAARAHALSIRRQFPEHFLGPLHRWRVRELDPMEPLAPDRPEYLSDYRPSLVEYDQVESVARLRWQGGFVQEMYLSVDRRGSEHLPKWMAHPSVVCVETVILAGRVSEIAIEHLPTMPLVRRFQVGWPGPWRRVFPNGTPLHSRYSSPLEFESVFMVR